MVFKSPSLSFSFMFCCSWFIFPSLFYIFIFVSLFSVSISNLSVFLAHILFVCLPVYLPGLVFSLSVSLPLSICHVYVVTQEDITPTSSWYNHSTNIFLHLISLYSHLLLCLKSRSLLSIRLIRIFVISGLHLMQFQVMRMAGISTERSVGICGQILPQLYWWEQGRHLATQDTVMQLDSLYKNTIT